MNISRYNKFIGALVGGLIGIGLNALGVTETVDVPVQYIPLVDSLVTAITAGLGALLAPKNAPT